MLDGFAKRFYDENSIEVEKIVPTLKLSFGDNELTVKGTHIPYSDVTKFVKRDGHYYPYMCVVGNEKKDDIVIDFAPLLNVGIAELISMLGIGRSEVGSGFFEECQELEVTDNWYSMFNRMMELYNLDHFDGESCVTLSECLRSSLIDNRFPVIRSSYATLQTLWWLSPKAYSRALFEATQLLYPAVVMFTQEEQERVFESGNFEDVGLGERYLMFNKLMRLGALEYTVESTKKVRKISDSRGLGLLAICLFICDVYERFANKSKVIGSAFRCSDSDRVELEEKFMSCIGDDFVGRFITNGRCRVYPCSDSNEFIAYESQIVPVDCQIETKNGIGRGLHEAGLMWKYACGIEKIDNVGQLLPMDCTYGSRRDMMLGCFWFVFSERGVRMTHSAEEYEAAQVLELLKDEVDIDEIVDQYRQSVRSEFTPVFEKFEADLKSKEAAVEAAERRLKETERLLVEKTDIINQLRAENASLRSKEKRMYSEEAYLDDDGQLEETDVSTEEMLRFVNQFKLVVVGGRDNMEQRLENFGFTNCNFITSERASRGTLVNGDFFCLCTKFLAHKLVFSVEAHYANQLEQFMYFNGTNPEVFLRVCYDFMHSWFAENAQGDATQMLKAKIEA